MGESVGHFPVVAGFGEAAGAGVPPVALTAGSSVPFRLNGPGARAGGGGGVGAGMGGGAGWPAGIAPGGGAAGAGSSSIRVGSS